MKKVIVRNTILDEEVSFSSFSSDDEMNDWISNRNLRQCSNWGWNARVIREEDMESKWEPIVLSRYQEDIDGTLIDMVSLDKEYVIEIVDLIDEEREAKQIFNSAFYLFMEHYESLWD